MASGMNRAAAVVLVAGTIIGNGSAMAQGRLPDPPAATTAAYTPGKIDNYSTFVATYQRSGRPRLFVYTDIVTRNGAAASGDIGDVTRLSGRVEEFFRHPDVVLVNIGGQALLTAQQMTNLRANDEFAAAKMVGQSAKADVVLFVRLVEQEGRRDGSNYLGTMTLADLRQGTTLGRHTWEMSPEISDRGQYTSQRMGEYAKAIARKAAQMYIDAYPGAEEAVASGGVEITSSGKVIQSSPAVMRRFSLLLVGDYEDDTLSDFRDAIKSIPGMRRDSILLRDEGRGNGGSVATFEMMYAGDSLDLRSQVRRAAVSQMGMEATVISSREGAIEVKLGALGLSTRERALSGGPETSRNADERAMLAYRYDKAGSPSIAVMMNEATVEVEDAIFIEPVNNTQGGSALQQGDGVNIVIGDRIGVSADGQSIVDPYSQMYSEREEIDARKARRQDAAIDTMFFENKVVERLVQLGLKPRDVSAAQIDMADDLAARTWKDRELAAALGKKSGADVVLSGVGRLVRDRETAKPVRIIFTLRAYQTSDGTIIGSASVSRDVSGGDRTFNQSLEELSAEATGKLVAQMSDAWNRTVKATPKDEAPAEKAATDETGTGGPR